MPASRLRRSNVVQYVLLVAASFGCTDAAKDPAEPALRAAVQPPVEQLGSSNWQQLARTLVGSHNLSPLAATRAYAILSVAQYAAINAVAEQGSTDGTLPNVGFGAGGRARFEAERGAVAGASAAVLRYVFPNAGAAIDALLASESTLFSNEQHPQFTRGLEAGTAAGAAQVARARVDHFTDVWTGTVPVGPGLWVNNGPPAGPLFGTVTPYFMSSGSQFRPAPPPAFGSAEFNAALAEIVQLSATRTAAQLATAIFWNFPTGSYTPPGYWNLTASGLISEYRLNERAATHVYALMHAAMMDSMIGCWEAKYFYWLLRPSQAAAPGSITLPIGLPNHPSYPSGHSCQSAAATTVMSHFFPAESATLAAQLTEAGLSRMYGGIHYRFDITGGNQIGRSAAQRAISVDQASGPAWLD